MLHSLLNQPPATHDLRPEKRDERPGSVEVLYKAVTGGAQRFWRAHTSGLARILPMIEEHAAPFGRLSDVEILEEGRQFGLKLRRYGFRDDIVAGVFALVREVAGRKVGKRHYDVQLMGGLALLKGMVAEMETGEGKTLTATLAASTAALAGVPVHVMTVNDYLTRRDADEMAPVYRALGLSVGCIVHDVPVAGRRHEYSCDITYCTNKEIVFDYLRDKLTLNDMGGAPLRVRVESLYAKQPRHSRLLLRGLFYAITDEADSLLIDESRTPLIISGSAEDREGAQFMRNVIEFAGTLECGHDFAIDSGARQVWIKEPGERKILDMVFSPDVQWAGTIRRNEMVRRALAALHVYERDKDYLVREGKIQIIDVYTGRVMPDRSWEQGLQQLIEIKEGCELTRQQETVAKISYQRFFRRYLHLAGMTGTAREVKGEFWSVYGLPVVSIRTHRPLRRVSWPDRVFADQEERDAYLLDRVGQLHASGRPVLIGTASVAASEITSRLLDSAGFSHKVLNAKNDAEEAEIVALAGERGAITIATNMAGRGTDIKLASGIVELGGLHVVLTGLHEAARIDRQLAGRCARQGDPGSFEAILLLDDSILNGDKGGLAGLLLRRVLPKKAFFWNRAAKCAIVNVQKETERIHGRMRRELFRQDVLRKNLMSFSRREE